MTVRENAVGRALASLSLGMTRTIQKREAQRKEMGLGETELQFQVAISGDAGTAPDWQSVALAFDSPFYYAPGNRDSDFDRPHFRVGVVMDGGQPVVASAHVTGWTTDPETDAVTGATVMIGAHAPDAEDPVPFAGSVHLSFQGYSGISEDETDI